MLPVSDPLVSLGWSAISWIEHYLVHGPGDVQGERIVLDDEMAAFILKCYRLDPVVAVRRIKRAFLSRAKGRAKSEIAAMLACFEALGPCRFDHWAEADEVSAWGYGYAEGEPVGKPLRYVEVLCVATEENQAGNTYDNIRYMLGSQTASAELLADYPGLDVGLTRVNLPDSRGSIEPVSSGDSSKDGGKSTFIVADETHLWLLKRLREMHAVMCRNLMKRKLAQGWMLETSTMYGEGEGSVAEGTHAYAMTVRTGKRKDASLLFDHRQASMAWDLADRAQRVEALREAYGPAADWMPLEDIADYWDDPQVTEAAFRRYFLNQPVPMEDRPLSILPKWGACLSGDRPLGNSASLALAVSMDRTRASIGGAVQGDRLSVKVLRHGVGLNWIVAEAKALQDALGGELVVDGKGPGASLIDRLEDAGVRLKVVDAAFICDAAELLLDATEAEPGPERLEHFGQPELEAAVAIAAWRSIGDRKALGRRASVGDISPLEAVALAAKEAPKTSVYDQRGVLSL
ncbi:MAG: hypothetical protein IPJ61_20910 [Tessaracoccus sp.]|nr:hypothetical protein [Tessaracoccus sp.]